MFNRYWREYPRFLQLILLMLMAFTMTSFSAYVGFAIVGKIYGASLNDIQHITTASSAKIVQAGRFVQLISSLFTFLVTAMLFAYLTHPKPFTYLGLKKPVKNGRFLLILLLVIGFIPLAEQIGIWMRHIDFGKNILGAQQEQDETYKAFLKMDTPATLFYTLFIFAVLPAFGEELFFRGLVMRFAYNGTRNIWLSIFISGAIFAFAHATLYNFLPILLAGLLLGYIYYQTGSIWFSIAFHLLNNGVQVLLEYLSQHKMIPLDTQGASDFPLYVTIAALVLFVLSGWLLKKNATPLANGWSNDFDLPEILAKEE